MAWCFRLNLLLPRGQLSFVDKWPIMSPSEVIFILSTYLLFTFKIGPYIMAQRQPLQIRRFLVAYNGVKILNSAYLTFKFFSYIQDKGLFPRKCDHDDWTTYTIAALYWKYLATKLLDLCDTIFFVLRKKTSQITFLHVYHHAMMVILTWSCLKYDPSDHWAFMAVMNCGIHAIMYTYYGIAALGPNYVKWIWWKKYVTVMQLTQFVLATVHIIVQTYTSQCPMHPGSFWVGFGNLSLFLVLFTDFYKKRYSTLSCVKQID